MIEDAISSPDIVHYFGTGRRYGKVSNIVFHNSLMVQFWSALASRDTRPMTEVLGKSLQYLTNCGWATFVRNDAEVSWPHSEVDSEHRVFLSDYYAGGISDSHARGAVFQFNPLTGDRRISGTCASLAGLEQAIEGGDERLIILSIERILLGHALICGFGGIPMLYMGDEIGMTNDYSYLEDPSHADDNRWLHRPVMDWEAAARRHQPDTVEGRIFAGVAKIVRARKRTPHLHSAYATDVIASGHPQLFVHARPHPLGSLVAVYNFSEAPQRLDAAVLHSQGLSQPFDQLEQTFVDLDGGSLALHPYQRYWLI